MIQLNRLELKGIYKMICITHPMDLYDFLADNNADPHTGKILSHDELINFTFDYVLKNGSDAFYEFYSQMECNQ